MRKLLLTCLLAAALFPSGARAVMNGQGLDIFPVDAIFNSSVTVPGGAFSVGGSTLAVSYGRIGLGTDVPASPLEIVSGGGSNGQLRLRTTQDVSSGGSVFLRLNDVNGSAGYVGFGGNNNTLNIFNYKAGPMQFAVDNKVAMALGATGLLSLSSAVASGNVAIGTTTAYAPLDIAGDLRMGTPDDATGSTIWLKGHWYNGAGGSGFKLTYDPAVSELKFFREYGSWIGVPAMSIRRDNGNVAIGTTTAAAPLEVKADSNNDAIRIQSNGNNYCILRISETTGCGAGTLIGTNSNRALCLICN